MDTSHLQQQLTEAFDHFIKPFSGLSNETVNDKPKQGSWTIGQLAQHVVLATSGVPDGSTKPANRKMDQLEQEIIATFTNQEVKFTSPEPLEPEKKQYDRDQLLKQLERNKLTLINVLKEKELSELCLDMELPVWGYLTRYEWIKLITYHTERHVRQLEKLSALQKKTLQEK